MAWHRYRRRDEGRRPSWHQVLARGYGACRGYRLRMSGGRRPARDKRGVQLLPAAVSSEGPKWTET